MKYLYAKSLNADASSSLVGFASLPACPSERDIDAAAHELVQECGFKRDLAPAILELYDGDLLVRDMPAEDYRPTFSNCTTGRGA